jgi:hypothetical protein
MKASLFLLLPVMVFHSAAAPAPVTVSDDELLKMVKERQQSLKCLTPEPRWVPGRMAQLCAPPSPQLMARESKMPHLKKFIKIFVTAAGEAAATGHECTYPPGTVVIKEKLPAVAREKERTDLVKPGTEPELFTGMLKREKGFHPEAGDWEFFTVSGDAAKITSRGKLESCIDCHKEYAQTDGISRQYLDTPVIQPDKSGTIELHAKDAEVRGKMLRYEPKPEKNTLGYWTEKDDRANWTFAAKKMAYDVEVLQGCGKGSGGAEVEVQAGREKLKFTVEDTGHFRNFKPRIIGRISLENGNCAINVTPLTKPGAAVMDLRSITLRPVKKGE